MSEHNFLQTCNVSEVIAASGGVCAGRATVVTVVVVPVLALSTQPGEAEVEDDECGKLTHWLYRCRPAAQAWEEHHPALLKNHGFKR